MKMPFFDKTVRLLSSFLNLFASAGLIAIILLTCADVSMGYFFNRPIAGTYDLENLMGALLAALAGLASDCFPSWSGKVLPLPRT